MRVAVLQALLAQQGAVGFQCFQHRLVGIPHQLAGKLRRVGQELAIRADRVVHRQLVMQAHLIIFQTVCRRGVHQAGTAFDGDVQAADQRHLLVVERMLQRQLFQRRALGLTQQRCTFKAITLDREFGQIVYQNQQAFWRIQQVVGEFRVHTYRFVGRQGPRGGGPDHCVSRPVADIYAKRLAQRSVVEHLEADIDGWRVFVLVFHFGFGQRRAAVQTPVNRLGATEQIAVVMDRAKGANNVRLGVEIHGLVRLVPIAEHAQSHEVGLLAFDLAFGVFAAQLAEFVWLDVFAVQFFDLVLNRQAVAIPAWHVGRIEAGQRLRFDNDVLEDLVDRMANVDVAVGVGWAIVQDELWPAGCLGANLLIQLALLPLGKHARFALGQIAAHRKAGIRQVEGILVVSHVLVLSLSIAAVEGREKITGVGNIAGDGLGKGVQIGIFFFVAQLVQKVHAQMLAVNIPGKIENVHFQRQLALVVDGRAHAQAGHAAHRALSQSVYLHHADAGQRRLVVFHLDIGGGEAQSAANLVAMQHPAADRIRPTQQLRRQLHIAAGQRLAHRSAGYA